MKTYKHTIIIPFLYFITNVMVFCAPVLVVFWAIVNKGHVAEALLVYPYMLLTGLMIYLIAYLVNLIYQLSTKQKVTLTDDKIMDLGKEVKLEFVDRITLKYGLIQDLSDKNAPRGAGLFLYNVDNLLLYIKNPNIILISKLLKKCKGAKKEIYNKKLLIAVGIVNGICLLTWLILFFISL